MAPPPASAKITLSYPLYACDFDPRNQGFLLVGGGGGEGRSGIANKITLLNTFKKNELSEVVDIELSKDEDSVTTLAYAQSTDQWATAFAGINSSQEEQKKGRNEHLRGFLLEYPPLKQSSTEELEAAQKGIEQQYTGETKALGRASLFTTSSGAEKLTYQRVLRLSKKVDGTGPRMGVTATGLAPEGEVVVFAADTSRPGKDDVRARLNLGKNVEAADVDIIALEPDEKRGDGNFRVTYCTDYDVYLTDVNFTYNHAASLDPQCVHGTGHPDAFASKSGRPKFRCLRFLTPTLLLGVQNYPKQKGAELFVLEISGAIIARKRLHGKIRSATGLSVAALPYPSNYNHVQHVIAIAGADQSITILTLDHPGSSPYGRKLVFRKYAFLRDVHPNSTMSLNFAHFTPPTNPYYTAPTQYLKLASTSMVNTCVVHTMVLSPFPVPTSKEDRPSYLLNAPSKSSITQNTFSVLMAIIAIAIGSFFLQAFTEIRGGMPEYLGAKDWLSKPVHDWIARPYMFEEGVQSAWSRSISSEVETASSILSSVVETPSSVLSKAAGTASDAASSASSAIGEDVSTASSAASEKASTASSKISKGASEASAKASKGASKASGKASKGSSSASSKVSDAASPAVKSASSMASDASSAASSAASLAAESASSMSATAADVAASAASVGGSLAKSAEDVASSAASLASSAASEASSSASSGANAYASSASSAGSKAYSAATDAADAAQETSGLRALLAARNTGSDTYDAANTPHEIVVRHSEEESALSVETHPAEHVVQREMKVKRWEEMGKKEKEGWKRRLLDAGEWTLEEGESILQGVLFSGLAGAVGAVVGGG